MGERLNAEQLRSMALNATGMITASAAPEYAHYVKVHEERGAGGSAAPSVGEAAPGRGAGAIAVVVVLTAVSAATAAVVFLLVGFLLKLLNTAPAFAGVLVTGGWLFSAIAGVGILVAVIGVLLTALCNSTTSADPYGRNEDVDRAREAWREALLQRGVLPFLRDALSDPGATHVARAPSTDQE
ncbi:hypothetical protein [Streptomyces sp. NPDC058644]|uniref:hypothetical protein n=1 Tax=unclassified Streptomyces TaxID=2593676 RepID=UPI003663BF8C